MLIFDFWRCAEPSQHNGPGLCAGGGNPFEEEDLIRLIETVVCEAGFHLLVAVGKESPEMPISLYNYANFMLMLEIRAH